MSLSVFLLPHFIEICVCLHVRTLCGYVVYLSVCLSVCLSILSFFWMVFAFAYMGFCSPGPFPVQTKAAGGAEFAADVGVSTGALGSGRAGAGTGAHSGGGFAAGSDAESKMVG